MIKVSPVNIKTWSKLGQRGTAFGIALPDVAKERDGVFVATADLGLLSGLERFKKSFPDRFLNLGIAEQNMVGVAAGLAKEGFCVFATTYATFITMRCMEQVRHNLGYQQCNVKLVGSSSGLAMGMSGNTHYAVEDIAVMRAIPNVVVVSPADGLETLKMVQAAAVDPRPMYIRLSGGLNCPIVYEQDYNFQIGRAVELQSGEDIAILATGSMVRPALDAAAALKKEGLSVTVVNVHTIKPLDTEAVGRAAREHRLLVTMEEHGASGGLGGAVAECKAAYIDAPPQLAIGLPDAFGKADEYGVLLERYGLTATAVTEKIRRAWERVVHGVQTVI